MSGAAAPPWADAAERYARQLALPEVGAAGQARLARARVLLVGAGGLGSPAALYLAAAGVGHLGVVDPDRVDASNLHRQVLHGTGDVGRFKAESARDRLAALNPHVRVDAAALRLTAANARALLAGYHVVVDGSDNFAARYAVNDAAVALGVPVVHGAATRFDGQASVFAPTAAAGDALPGAPWPESPCYRCLFPAPPAPGTVPSCEEGGVLGAVPGIVGAVQAAEALKLLLGVGEPLVGRLLLVDVRRMRFHTVALRRDPACPACGAGRRDAGGAADGGGPEEVTPAALAARLAAAGAGVELLDVREPREHARARLPGARLVPLGALAEAAGAGRLDPARETVVYCARGPRSAEAAALLRARGFARVRALAGGIERWAREGGPVESGATGPAA